MDQWIVGLHALAGAVALVSMWVPLVSTKGGRAHRFGGKVYTAAMAAVVVFAWVVCAIRVTDGEPGNDGAAWFLAMIAVLAGDSTWFGWRMAGRDRGGPLDNVVPGFAVLSGFAGIGLAVQTGFVLAGVFGGLCALLGAQQIRTLRRGEPTGKARIREHLGAMIAACIATVTAFVVVNTGHLQLPVSPLVVWLAPTVLGVPAIFWFSRRNG
ncbi:MAG: hypothetical protein ACI8PZ_000019 [Myxococcota bacterium]|jgi:hypothetical protein